MTASVQTMKSSDVRRELDELLDRVYRGEACVLVEKSGVPVAVIVSPEDWRRFEECECDREDPFAILDEMGAAFKDVPLEEIERETEKALAEVRAEMQAERAAAAAAARE
jgi:prevent-host-death family protein